MIFVVDVRAGVSGAGPRHRALPAQRRQEGAARGQQGRGHGRFAAARRVPRARPRRAACRSRRRTARASAASPRRRCGGARRAGVRRGARARAGRADPAAVPIRLAVAGRPNVGKSTLINAWLGEERLVAFDQPGTTRDAIVVPFERGGQPLRPDRHRRPAAQGQGVRGGREVLGRQDAAGDRRGQRRPAPARRHPGRHRPGRAHRRLHPRERPGGGGGGQQVGRGRRLPEGDSSSARSSSACRS